MQAQANPRRECGCDPPPVEIKDARVQRTVLALVLDAHPKSLTIPYLAREIAAGDAVERAVVALVNVGLLYCGGITLRPSAAALHFQRLDLP